MILFNANSTFSVRTKKKVFKWLNFMTFRFHCCRGQVKNVRCRKIKRAQINHSIVVAKDKIAQQFKLILFSCFFFFIQTEDCGARFAYRDHKSVYFSEKTNRWQFNSNRFTLLFVYVFLLFFVCCTTFESLFFWSTLSGFLTYCMEEASRSTIQYISLYNVSFILHNQLDIVYTIECKRM